MDRQKVEQVAAYVRVSTQEQKLHGLSLDAQKMKLTTYAKANNMKIVGWYVDEGVSARKLIKNRPELQRMVQDAEAGQFERIIFIKLDRFFRSVAEYHECMKRIAPVVWSATEEEYDLTTANGRMLVNAKLMIAELEADMAGERIDVVNDYKVQTGQPLSGSQPFGFVIARDEQTGRKKIIRDPENEEALRDAIQHYLTHQSRKKTLVYLHTKHGVSMSYNSLKDLLANTMLYGEYRGNPSYCDAYIDKATFDEVQEISRRNIKDNTAENRAYIFSGLIVCPLCERKLKSYIQVSKNSYSEKRFRYKRYRCGHNYRDGQCAFNKTISENVLERMLLNNIEVYMEQAKLEAATVSDGADKPLHHDLDDIHAQIDRLNYSWQTGKIRTVEQYEKDYAELIEKMELAEAERRTAPVKDFGKVECILHDGWRAVYDSLDDAYKRAFWRSFIQSIEIDWTTEKKEIKRVNFF